jgi:ribose transport system permease protein
MIARLRQSYATNGVIPTIAVVTFAGFALAQPKMFSVDAVSNVLQQSSFLALAAIGQMFVLINRGFDLSISYNISATSVLSALVMNACTGLGNNNAAMLGMLAALGVGAVIGLVNGVGVALLRINPFVVTLGTQGVLFSVATMASKGFPVAVTSSAFVKYLGGSGEFPVATCMCLAAIVLAHILMKRTPFGRSIYFSGGNPEAAIVAGLPVASNLIWCYLICSLFGSIDALFLMARAGSGEPNLGGGIMLQSIAAAVIGGISLRGGEGSVLNAVFGSILLVVFSVGMNMNRIDGNLQLVVMGAIVIGAIYLDRFRASHGNGAQESTRVDTDDVRTTPIPSGSSYE